MPLGILTDDEFDQEVAKANSNGSLKKPSEETLARIVQIERGRGNKQETPESARKLISELAINGADVSEIAHEFNVSPSSISAYKHGSTSTASYNEPNKELRKHNNLVRDRIIKKARKKLVLAIDSIDEQKIADCDARGLAGIAKDMSAVIKNLEPEIKESGNLNAQFVFFAPQVKKEIDYPIIDVID